MSKLSLKNDARVASKRKQAMRGEALPSNTIKSLMKDFTLEDVHQYRLNRHSFTIFVGGDPLVYTGDGAEPGVEYNMADRFEMNLNLLSSINPERPILVSMASCGGDWEEGMQMFGAILTCPNPVTVLGTKWCRSMTSIIPLAADRFVIRRPAKYMIHYGSYGFEGTDQEADTDDIERRKYRELMVRLYIARLREQGSFKRSSEQRIREMIVRRMKEHIDVWYSTDEAVAAGFADDVFDGDYKTLRATKKNMDRRQRLLDVLGRPINVKIDVT